MNARYKIMEYVTGIEEIYIDKEAAKKRLIELWDSKSDDEKKASSCNNEGDIHIMELDENNRFVYSGYCADVPCILFEFERYKEARDFFEEELLYMLNLIEDPRERESKLRKAYVDDLKYIESKVDLKDAYIRIEYK